MVLRDFCHEIAYNIDLYPHREPIMQLSTVDFTTLKNATPHHALIQALYRQGIVGIYNVPEYAEAAKEFIDQARTFSALPDAVKQQYAPPSQWQGLFGYELGAEKFKNDEGQWQVDDKKASYYATYPDSADNIWPEELDLRATYLRLAKIIFNTGVLVMSAAGLNENIGIRHDAMSARGRLLHYLKNTDTNANPDWCGAHYDHSIFTGLMPAYYYQGQRAIAEPDEAGLYIIPTGESDYVKIHAEDHNLLLFQVGEFGQLASNDAITATRHIVKKSYEDIERFTFAFFFEPDAETTITPTSTLTQDARYQTYQQADGSISYAHWHHASIERYRS